MKTEQEQHYEMNKEGNLIPICSICDRLIQQHETTVIVIWFYGMTFHLDCRFSEKGHEYLGEKA